MITFIDVLYPQFFKIGRELLIKFSRTAIKIEPLPVLTFTGSIFVSGPILIRLAAVEPKEVLRHNALQTLGKRKQYSLKTFLSSYLLIIRSLNYMKKRLIF